MRRLWSVHRHPYATVCLLELLIVGVFVLSGAVVFRFQLPNLVLGLLATSILTVIAASLLTIRGCWGTIGFRWPRHLRELRWFWLPCLPIVVPPLVYGVSGLSWGLASVLLLLAVLVGIVEEVYFRGLMVHVLVSRGVWRTALISAGLFGVTHALNVLSGSDPIYVLLQIGYAFALGFCYAALVLRTNLLWPLVLTHILTDVAAYFTTGRTGAAGVDASAYVISIAYIIAFVGYGSYILRDHSQPGALFREEQPADRPVIPAEA